MLKYKNLIKIALIISLFLLLVGLSMTAISAVDINNNTAGGIKGAVSATPNEGTINLAPGIYTGDSNKEINIDKSLTIRGNGPSNTVTIDAKGEGVLFYIGKNSDNNVKVTFININFNNGFTTGNSAAIDNRNGDVTIIDSTFANNKGDWGGAIHNSGNMYVTGCNFINNTADFHGGAIFNDGANMVLSGCNFINNRGIDGGGVVCNSFGANMVFFNSNFINNTGSHGGVLCNFRSHLYVYGSSFINNTADTGGVIYNYNNANMYIYSSSFTNNLATSYGGVFYNEAGSKLTIISSNFKNNEAKGSNDYDDYDDYGGGGGIWICSCKSKCR